LQAWLGYFSSKQGDSYAKEGVRSYPLSLDSRTGLSEFYLIKIKRDAPGSLALPYGTLVRLSYFIFNPKGLSLRLNTAHFGSLGSLGLPTGDGANKNKSKKVEPKGLRPFFTFIYKKKMLRALGLKLSNSYVASLEKGPKGQVTRRERITYVRGRVTL
jgi:hypothetical protein